MMTRDGTSLAYLGDPLTIASLPRGAFVYATDHLTEQESML